MAAYYIIYYIKKAIGFVGFRQLNIPFMAPGFIGII
jgi:hypothetical protein